MKRYTHPDRIGAGSSSWRGVAQAGKANKADKPAKADKVNKKDGVIGTVVKSDASSITVQTRGKKGAEVTVAIDANTKFEGVAAAADLKAGQRVIATPNTAPRTKNRRPRRQGRQGRQEGQQNAAK